jgi:hypothetical protein
MTTFAFPKGLIQISDNSNKVGPELSQLELQNLSHYIINFRQGMEIIEKKSKKRNIDSFLCFGCTFML